MTAYLGPQKPSRMLGAPHANSDDVPEVLHRAGATASEMIAASLAGGIVAARSGDVTPDEAYAVYDWVYALVRKKRGSP